MPRRTKAGTPVNLTHCDECTKHLPLNELVRCGCHRQLFCAADMCAGQCQCYVDNVVEQLISTIE